MEYIHCDKNDNLISLHDCKAERAWFENGVLGFEFPDGFWITPDHPESDLDVLVRTDASKLEFVIICDLASSLAFIQTPLLN